MAKFKFAGDSSIVIEFENTISKKVNWNVINMFKAVQKSQIKGIEEMIPSYRSILVNYNPQYIHGASLINKLKTIEANMIQKENTCRVVFEIPVIYGGDYGPDLDFVARHNNLTVDEVIKIHAKPYYYIFALGFTPGFPYLGGMSETIATPRLAQPRIRIPEGSVGIAGSQTGIYSVESPGGWRIIGQTPLKLFNPYDKPHFMLEAGSYVKFIPIDKNKFDHIKQLVEKGTYHIKKYQN